ncbi:MAG: hypothetical protein ABIL52_07080 [candidate division WOR-3 bacterium]
MIEKINKILEKLPEEYRDSIREIVEIIIKEEIEQNRRMIQELWDIIKEGNKVNERLWKTVEILGQRVDNLTQAVNELRQITKEQGEKIMELTRAVNEVRQITKEHGERIEKLEKALAELTEKLNNLIRAIEEMRKANQEQFEKIWQVITELTQAVNELREIIKEHGERIDRLEKAVMELTQAVSELRQAVDELRQITKEQGEKIDNLTKAFERSEKVNKQTRKKLETLSDNFGYLLEDRAIRYLPKLLKEKYNIEIIEPLKRDYIEIKGRYIEVNIYGKGKRDGEEFIIIGEAKTRLSQKEVNKFILKCNRLGGKQFRIIISYLISPQLKDVLLNNNIEFINSYELEI